MARQASSARRILVVDDEESVGFFLRASLEEVRRGYQVELASSGQEALRHMSRQAYDLVITDLRMPGMDGLQLMEEVRRRHPYTRLILMTAYGNASVESTAYRLGACRYINKPFSIDELTDTVSNALEETEVSGRQVLMLSDDEFERIAQCLANLRFEVGAQCILLADVAGQMVAHVGETQGLDLTALVSLIGGSFATSAEMARYLGEREVLTLNYHEGERYDVYSSNVNEDLFIVLVFHRGQQRSRVGIVWLYARRALDVLRDLVAGASRVSTSEILDADFGALLSDSFDQLLDTQNSTRTRAVAPKPATRPQPPVAPSRPQAGEEPHTRRPTFERGVDEAGDGETLSLRQALEMGLLDPTWLDSDREQRRADDGGGQDVY
ncbi:MAG TPA: response regulator [Anaerolineae bacterium]|nr:response regulator [Anaerolineae bacterium]